MSTTLAAVEALAEIVEGSDRPSALHHITVSIAAAERHAEATGRPERFGQMRSRFTPAQVFVGLSTVAGREGDRHAARAYEALARVAQRHEITWAEVDAAAKGARR